MSPVTAVVPVVDTAVLAKMTKVPAVPRLTEAGPWAIPVEPPEVLGGVEGAGEPAGAPHRGLRPAAAQLAELRGGPLAQRALGGGGDRELLPGEAAAGRV